ncbi:hypothetical protein LTS12_019097 [Elasticomyces elasticus]|nr:hypothetical protein LTS12_019097 [Elasticomyces elasticus]
MSVFEDTPFINTGNATIDTQCGVVFSIGVVVAAYYVFKAFSQAHRGRPRYSSRRLPDRTNAIRAFYVLALVSFVTVSWLRTEHRRIKLISIEEIRTHRQTTFRGVPVLGSEPKSIQIPGQKAAKEFVDAAANAHLPTVDDAPSFDEVTSGVVHGFQSVTSFVGKAAKSAGAGFHAVGDGFEAAADPGKVASKAKKQLDKHGRAVKTTLVKTGKQLVDDTAAGAQYVAQVASDETSNLWNGKSEIPEDLAKMFHANAKASVWDFFVSLVNKAPRFFWTQEWLAGYIVWAVYVGLQCAYHNVAKLELHANVPQTGHYHDYGDYAALSFILLGWCTSLAAMQCLFFALNLDMIDHRRAARVDVYRQGPLPVIILGTSVVSMIFVLLLSSESARAGWMNVLHSGVMFVPILGAWMLSRSRRVRDWTLRYRTAKQGKSALTIIWWITGLFCIVSHLMAIHGAYMASDPSNRGRWWLPSLDRFRSSSNKPAHVFHSIRSVLGALGDHAWLNAVGWDVIFSLLSVSLWSAVSSAAPAEMVKCALYPWLDGTIEVAQEAAEYVQETTEPYIDATKQGFGNLQDAAEPYLEKTRQGLGELQEAAQPYVRKSKEYLDDGGEYLENVWDRNAPDAQEVVKKAKKGVNSGLEQLSSVSKRAVSSAAQLVTGTTIDEDFDNLFGTYSSNGPDAARQARARRTYNEQARDAGDEDDWKTVRSRKSPSPTKRRGRPPKDRSASEVPGQVRSASRASVSRSRTRNDERPSSPTPMKRRSSRLRNISSMPDSDERSWGLPDTGKVARVLRRNSLLPEQIEITSDVVEGAEAAGLTLGLAIFGGLGLASVGVFGN